MGDAALVRLVTAAVTDPATGAELAPAIPRGTQALIRSLISSYGLDEQDRITAALDGFFEFRRGKLSLQEYCSKFDARCFEAQSKAGLHINEV